MRSPPPAALVCLDLQRARLLGSPPGLGRVTATCRRVLDQARARGWPVLHVHRREATPEGARPIPGLEPLPSEPVFLRPGPSAFSHPAFARQAMGLGGPLALVGFSLADSVLATAFAAADRKLPVEVLADAVAADARDDRALRQALGVPLAALSPLCRLISADDLLREEAAAFAAANAP
ncbi:isochorismatase family protein [Phenylobacterium sp.]|uniref:isochorismatase family protein n=1 Tax=Phenylobacterium sp. TaxID=1871053 RepID=UPI00289D2CCD|nr:isochorismatase family protein [Phenylobacterium sp.]